jgi:hypothetical protein
MRSGLAPSGIGRGLPEITGADADRILIIKTPRRAAHADAADRQRGPSPFGVLARNEERQNNRPTGEIR